MSGNLNVKKANISELPAEPARQPRTFDRLAPLFHSVALRRRHPAPAR